MLNILEKFRETTTNIIAVRVILNHTFWRVLFLCVDIFLRIVVFI